MDPGSGGKPSISRRLARILADAISELSGWTARVSLSRRELAQLEPGDIRILDEVSSSVYCRWGPVLSSVSSFISDSRYMDSDLADIADIEIPIESLVKSGVLRVDRRSIGSIWVVGDLDVWPTEGNSYLIYMLRRDTYEALHRVLGTEEIYRRFKQQIIQNLRKIDLLDRSYAEFSYRKVKFKLHIDGHISARMHSPPVLVYAYATRDRELRVGDIYRLHSYIEAGQIIGEEVLGVAEEAARTAIGGDPSRDAEVAVYIDGYRIRSITAKYRTSGIKIDVHMKEDNGSKKTYISVTQTMDYEYASKLANFVSGCMGDIEFQPCFRIYSTLNKVHLTAEVELPTWSIFDLSGMVYSRERRALAILHLVDQALNKARKDSVLNSLRRAIELSGLKHLGRRADPAMVALNMAALTTGRSGSELIDALKGYMELKGFDKGSIEEVYRMSVLGFDILVSMALGGRLKIRRHRGREEILIDGKPLSRAVANPRSFRPVVREAYRIYELSKAWRERLYEQE